MTIDYSKREIAIEGASVTLSKKEFDIVELLSQNAGQVFDGERIYDIGWGLDGEGNSDAVMEHVRKICAKLHALSLHNYIETGWGAGYICTLWERLRQRNEICKSVANGIQQALYNQSPSPFSILCGLT